MLSDLLSWDISPKEPFGQFDWLQYELQRCRQDQSLHSICDLTSAVSSGIYQAFDMQLSSSVALPESIPAESVPLTGSEPLAELLVADHRQWPTLQVSPHSTPMLQLAPQDWRLELEGIGWFQCWL